MDTRSLGTSETSSQAACRFPPKIYYVHAAHVGLSTASANLFERCRAMGFDHLGCAPIFAPGDSGDVFLAGDLERAHPAFDTTMGADDVAAALAAECRNHELKLVVDIVVDRVDPRGSFAATRSDLFSTRSGSELPVDPRSIALRSRAAHARRDRPEEAAALAGFWHARLQRLVEAGVAGFRFIGPQALAADLWRGLLGRLKAKAPGLSALAWTPGLKWAEVEALSGAGFDGVFSSAAWWDYRAPWFVEEYDILRRVAPVLGCPEVPFERRLADRLSEETDVVAAYRRALRVLAGALDGMLMPAGFERAAAIAMDRRGPAADGDQVPLHDLAGEVREANAMLDGFSHMGTRNELRTLSGADDDTTVLLRLDANDARRAGRALAILVNPDATRPQQPTVSLDPPPPGAGAALGRPASAEAGDALSALAPAEVRLIELSRTIPVRHRARAGRRALEAAMAGAANRGRPDFAGRR